MKQIVCVTQEAIWCSEVVLAGGGLVLLRVMSENMDIVEKIEGSSTRGTKSSAKKSLLVSLIKADPKRSPRE